MSTPYVVRECRQCGYVAHPPRLLCPNCAADDWKPRETANGVVTELTVRRPVGERRQLPSGDWLEPQETRLACVVCDGPVRIVARADADVDVGDHVSLTAVGDSAIALATRSRSPPPADIR